MTREIVRQLKESKLKVDLRGATQIVSDSSEFEKDYFKQMVKDADYSPASSGVPNYFTVAWTNKIIEQVVQRTSFLSFATPFQNGDFASTSMSFPTISWQGAVTEYSDLSKGGNTGANANWVNRNVYRMETFVKYGDLDIATMAAGKIDWVAEQREAAAVVLNQQFNQIGFTGVADKQVYGLLNDPGLAAAIPLPASAGTPASSKWKDKTPVEICKDLLLMLNDIIERASANVSISQSNAVTDKIYLLLYPSDMTYLLTPTDQFLKAPIDFIKAFFPNLELIPAMQYLVGDGSAGNKAQMIFEKIAGKDVIGALYTFMLQSHGAVRYASHIEEKFSQSSGGAGVFVPIGIATATGV
jgi:hypothetical protein